MDGGSIRVKVDQHVIKQLNAWMDEAGIHLLELTTAETSLSLQRDVPAFVPPEGAGDPPARPAPVEGATDYELTAPSPGVYLDRHPLSTKPLVTSDALIEAGQLVGFLRIQNLLLPLRSARAGRVVRLPQHSGDTLGYGNVVLCLRTEGRS
jgi:acetyl-CoA carboxylase biotin carboxyl carrier protein